MIFVFKTSVKTKKGVKQLSQHLDNMLKNSFWNFDLEDCDKILRIDTEETKILEMIVKLLNDKGFDCEELLD